MLVSADRAADERDSSDCDRNADQRQPTGPLADQQPDHHWHDGSDDGAGGRHD